MFPHLCLSPAYWYSTVYPFTLFLESLDVLYFHEHTIAGRTLERRRGLKPSTPIYLFGWFIILQGDYSTHVSSDTQSPSNFFSFVTRRPHVPARHRAQVPCVRTLQQVQHLAAKRPLSTHATARKWAIIIAMMIIARRRALCGMLTIGSDLLKASPSSSRLLRAPPGFSELLQASPSSSSLYLSSITSSERHSTLTSSPPPRLPTPRVWCC